MHSALLIPLEFFIYSQYFGIILSLPLFLFVIIGILRIHAIHDAKCHQNLLIHDISKIRGAFF